MAASEATIFVLTDSPSSYGDRFDQGDAQTIYVKDIGPLIDRLRNIPMAGLVLEVDKVMKADRRDRDRLFNYAGSFPVLRSRLLPPDKRVSFLDSPDCFVENLAKAVGIRCRNHERTEVEMPCVFAKEDDPSLADAFEGVIKDISPGGCYIATRQICTNESFLHLRIPELSMRPIYSSIRWVKQDSGDDGRSGMGVMFIDLDDSQMKFLEGLQQAE